MKWKVAIGIILIVASIAGMYLWETQYRDAINMEEVLVANRDIDKYEVVSASDFDTVFVNSETVIYDNLTREDLDKIEGQLADVPIYANQQIKEEFFVSPEDKTPEGYRHFEIPSEWIYTKSETLSENETIRLFAVPEDSKDLSVETSTDSAIEEGKWFERPEDNYLGTYKLSILRPEQEIEIMARIEDYLKMYDAVTFHNMKLVFVAEDE